MTKPLSFLLLGLLLFPCVTAQAKQYKHEDYLHAQGPQTFFSSIEMVLLHRFRRWFRNQGKVAPRHDQGLRRAATRLAQRLVMQRVQHLPQTWVNASLWLAGATDKRLRIFAFGFRQKAQLWKALGQGLRGDLLHHRPNFFGVAIASQGQKRLCVILFARRGVMLKPLARRAILDKKMAIRGQLLSGFSKPYIVLGLPSGRVVQPKVYINHRGEFVSWWRPRQTGKAVLQVIASDKSGPWISAETQVWVVAEDKGKLQRRVMWSYYRRFLRGHRKKALPKKPYRKRARWAPKAAATKLWRITNHHRKKRGLRVLHRHRRLDALAQAHANDMVRHSFFAHTSARSGSFLQRFRRIGWSVSHARENIVVAFSPQEAYRLLCKSPSHRSNLFNPRLRLMGIAVAKDAKGALFFVQVFTSPISSQTIP